MNLQDYYSSIRNYIVELSLEKWQNENLYPQSDIAEIRAIPRGQAVLQRRAKFRADRGRLVVPVKSAKEFGKWADWERETGKKYDPKVVHPTNKTLMTDYRGVGEYTVVIEWKDWRNLFRDYYTVYKQGRLKYIKTKRDIAVLMFFEADVRFDCNCPSFYWQGYMSELQRIDSAANPKSIPPSRHWVPIHRRHGARPPYIVCKHIRAVLRDLKNPVGYLMGKMYRSMLDFPAFQDFIYSINLEDTPEEKLTIRK